MIISFTIENWLSFRDKTTFSMVAGRERQHGHRVTKLKKYGARILPISAIYGANASGKSNLIKALNFAKDFIVNGVATNRPIPIKPFRLDKKAQKKPSFFCFEILIQETIYEFSFAITQHAVIEEKLIKVTPKEEITLYHRTDSSIEFPSKLCLSDEEMAFLDFAFRGTRDNELFLTNAVSQKVYTFKPVYDWFYYALQIILPKDFFNAFEKLLDEKNSNHIKLNEFLPRLDTGIKRIGLEEITFEDIHVPREIKNRLIESSNIDQGVRLINPLSDDRFFVKSKDGLPIAKRLVSYHTTVDGDEVEFQMEAESDGTRRLIDILPAFFDLSAENATRVYIVDEIDRSFHSLLTRALLEMYLETCTNKGRAQLIFTTHDAFLMDQKLLRRDEMWVAEKNVTGSSTLIALNEYKDIRYDKDIRKSYILGRFAGIPRFSLRSNLLKEQSSIDKNDIEESNG